MDALIAAKAQAEKETAAEGKPASPLVFQGRGGGRVWDFRKTLAKAIVKAGAQREGTPLHISPHMLRKAFIPWQKMRGIDDPLLQPAAGHAPGSAITARHYLHLPPEALRQAVLDLTAVPDKSTTAPGPAVSQSAPDLATSGNMG